MSDDSYSTITFNSFDIETTDSLKKFHLQLYRNLNAFKLEKNALVFSDIHGNPSCLNLALKFSKLHNINKIISLGDLVDYNPKGNEVVNIIQSTKDVFVSLAGNHENKKRFLYLKSVFDRSHKNEFDIETIDYILKLPEFKLLSIFGKTFLLTHCNPWNIENLFLNPPDFEAKNYFLDYIPFTGMILGHSHYLDHYQRDKQLILNPGSLGCANQDYVSFAWILPKENCISYYKIEVNHDNPLQVISDEPFLIKNEKYEFY